MAQFGAPHLAIGSQTLRDLANALARRPSLVDAARFYGQSVNTARRGTGPHSATVRIASCEFRAFDDANFTHSLSMTCDLSPNPGTPDQPSHDARVSAAGWARAMPS